MPLTYEEISFVSGQSESINNISCTELTTIDDSILEDTESLEINMTSFSSEVLLNSGMVEADVLIMEDAVDS